MEYWIYLRKKGELVLFDDSLLDLIPKRTLDLMEVNKVPEKINMCDDCNLDSHCHVMEKIDDNTYRKLCPILFHDVFNPPWKLTEIN